jgi:hypothetical protein
MPHDTPNKLSPLQRGSDWNARMQRQQALTSQIKQRVLGQSLLEKTIQQPGPQPDLDLLREFGTPPRP